MILMGSSVAPAELESVLLMHPDIADAAVIGVDSVEEPGTELPRSVDPARTDDSVKQLQSLRRPCKSEERQDCFCQAEIL